MAQQVSGSNLTLKDAIRSGAVEVPALMQWNTWQQWRRDTGLRPTAAADGEATTTALESALWKSTMLELYGPEWSLRLASNDEAQAPALVAQGRAPCLRPDADAILGAKSDAKPSDVPASPCRYGCVPKREDACKGHECLSESVCFASEAETRACNVLQKVSASQVRRLAALQTT